MDEKELLAEQKTEKKQEYKTEQNRGANYPLIKEAVARAVREYGKTLEKLAKDD